MHATIREKLRLPADLEGFAANTVLPAAIYLLILIPALATFFGGRDVELVTLPESPIVPDDPLVATLLKKVALLMLFGVAVSNFAKSWSQRDPGRSVYIALLVYFFSCAVLPGLFGKVITLPMAHVMCFIVMTAIFAVRDHGDTQLVRAVQNALFLFMVLSLIANPFYPSMTRRYIDDELRLPYLDYRFWGLSEHANSIATMSSTLLILTLVRPYTRMLVNIAALASGLAVLLMCQSQTSWIGTAAAVIVLLIYRLFGNRLKVPDFIRSPVFLVPLAIIATALLLVLIVDPPDMKWISDTVLAVGDRVVTGRGRVWQIALEMFVDYPLFGYGLSAWDDDFRAHIGLSWAVHSHNQLMQILSMAGIVGFMGAAYYIKQLSVAAFRQGAAGRGLAPALLIYCVVKSTSETPMDIDQFFLIGNVAHVTLYMIAVSFDPARVPALTRLEPAADSGLVVIPGSAALQAAQSDRRRSGRTSGPTQDDADEHQRVHLVLHTSEPGTNSS